MLSVIGSSLVFLASLWQKFSIEGTPLDPSTTHPSVSSVIKAVIDYSKEEGHDVILKELLHASVYDKPEQLLLSADFQELYKKPENDLGPKVNIPLKLLYHSYLLSNLISIISLLGCYFIH